MSSLLIKDGLLLTMEPGEPVTRGDLLIEHGRIAAISKVEATNEIEVLSATDRLVMPGFVQAHVHLAQTLFRGLANDVDLIHWLYERIFPLEAAHDEESLYDSARLGLAEMIRSGTTSVIDVGAVWHIDSIFQALDECGIRAQSGLMLMDDPETYPQLRRPTGEALQTAADTYDRWNGKGGGRLHGAFIPRGLLSVTLELVHELAKLAGELHAPIHTHAHESEKEIQRIYAKCGKRPLMAMRSAGITGPRLQLAHCVWLEPSEIDLLQEQGIGVVHCPSANAKLSSGIAPIPELLSRGITVGLGADGAPCNDNLDAFMEMRLAGLLQKLRLGPGSLPATKILSMATTGGAQVMGLEAEIGYLKVGMRGDVIIVNLEGLHANPFEPDSLVDLLVYAFGGGDVESTIVEGQILMRERVLTTMSERDVLMRARRSRTRVLERLRWN